MKQALKNLDKTKWTEDASGKRVALPDPAEELLKEQRRLEREAAEAMKQRDADIAAKEASGEMVCLAF